MERIKDSRGLLMVLATVSVVALAAPAGIGGDWQRGGNVGRAGVTDTAYLSDDFESYSSVDDPAFQATWTEGSVFGAGVLDPVPHDMGKTLSVSRPVRDHAHHRSDVAVSTLTDWYPGDGHKMHYPQTPKPGGWDVEFAWSRLADDWMCSETGPVSDIHFWISWMQDNVQPIEGFAVRIWSNNPVGPDGYSIPDSLLWEREFDSTEFDVIEWSSDLQGWFMPPAGGYFLEDHTRRFQINIEDIQDPFRQCEGTIYWLEIDFGPLNYIGWKETDQNWNDAAVFWSMAKWWEVIDPIQTTSIDLAFVITGPTEFGKTVNGTVDLSPFYDWGGISSYAGLAPPGGMGIYSPTHATNYYFPSDSSSPAPPNTPKAWLTPGIHLATSYGPATAAIPGNPMVTVFDRNSGRCSLFVEIPAGGSIDEAGDLNVIQISPGEQSPLIPIGDTSETVVFLANCDGWVFAPGAPSPDQPLQVILDYNGGTQDTVIVNDIHPAERANNVFSSANFIFCNEVLGCGPPYYDLPGPGYDHNHSEFWHWYTVYPDTTKLLDAIIFEGLQTADTSIYILAVSYSGPCCNGDGMRGNADGLTGAGGEVDVADLTYLVAYLFGTPSGPAPPCDDEGNVDGLTGAGGPTDVADLTYLVAYLFLGGPAPAPCP